MDEKIVILSEASRSFIARGEVEGAAVLHLASAQIRVVKIGRFHACEQ
jgi:hypothetical protein